ncbi:YeeE/YedE family protein [Rhodoferax sp.]|uniref:YeeE/YedE family protein n=1 Tax=Rhodoferax sp. TaxID=50421 RepID=UPI00374CCE49
MHPFLQAALGGILIGLACWLLLASLGRIAGISGIVAGLLSPQPGERGWRWAFLAGLVGVGGWLMHGMPAAVAPSWGLAGVAGLLVGFGTVLGSGCTSGHGVCGLGRRSLRSLVATVVFMVCGFATVFVARAA